jgi:hypothetical protein
LEVSKPTFAELPNQGAQVMLQAFKFNEILEENFVKKIRG